MTTQNKRWWAIVAYVEDGQGDRSTDNIDLREHISQEEWQDKSHTEKIMFLEELAVTKNLEEDLVQDYREQLCGGHYLADDENESY